jgi:anti-anti-sigma factor
MEFPGRVGMAGDEMAEISVDQASDQTRINLSGELDLQQTLELRPWLLTTIQLARTDVELNVAALSFLDCIGVGLLIEAWRCARDQGGTLTVVSPQHRRVRRVLDLLHGTLPFRVSDLGPPWSGCTDARRQFRHDPFD